MLRLRFLGTGTSAGVPMIGCDCDTCRSSDPRDHRSRCSVIISYPDAGSSVPSAAGGEAHTAAAGETDRFTVLVDAAPELRLQAVAADLRRVDAVVFTHGHADHIMGLDDLRRFNALRRGPLDVWTNQRTHRTLQTMFSYAFREPDPASRLFRPHLVPRIIGGPFDLGGITWTPVDLLHGDMPVLGFRVGDLAYCTDVSEIPPQSMERLRGLDVLVLSALQHRRHDTHFTVAQALEVVAELRPRRAYFTHIAHGILHARDEADLPDHVRFAYDGLEVYADLPASEPPT